MATYREAGVDLEAAADLVDRIAPIVKRTWSTNVVGSFGGFAAGLTLPRGYRNPVLMMSTDGVGTKAEIARQTDQIDGLGQDLVAMCADDLTATGARPIALTDYIAVGSLDVRFVERLVQSIAGACEAAEISLLGGETAEHPGVLEASQFDVSATALGIVEHDKVVDGSTITVGNRIIGLPSQNLRSNGFSLLRATLLDKSRLSDCYPNSPASIAETLMAPSIVYSPAVHRMLEQVSPRGMVHITGGGLAGNISRILPAGTGADIDPATWIRPWIFSGLTEATGADEPELYRTFNMGIGFAVIVSTADAAPATELLVDAGHDASEIGSIVPGNREVRIRGIE